MLLLQILLWSSVTVGFFIGLMNVPSEAEQREAVKQRLRKLKYIKHRDDLDKLIQFIKVDLQIELDNFQEAMVRAAKAMKDFGRESHGLQVPPRAAKAMKDFGRELHGLQVPPRKTRL